MVFFSTWAAQQYPTMNNLFACVKHIIVEWPIYPFQCELPAICKYNIQAVRHRWPSCAPLPPPPSLQWLSAQAFEYLVQPLIYSEVVAPALISTEGALYRRLMISIQSHAPTKPFALHSSQIILFLQGVSKKFLMELWAWLDNLCYCSLGLCCGTKFCHEHHLGAFDPA